LIIRSFNRVWKFTKTDPAATQIFNLRLYVNFIQLPQEAEFFVAPAPKVKVTLPDVKKYTFSLNYIECSLSIRASKHLIIGILLVLYVSIVISVFCCLKFKFAKNFEMDKQQILENQIASLKDIIDIQEKQLNSKFQGDSFVFSLLTFQIVKNF